MDIHHDTDGLRFVLTREGEQAVLNYRILEEPMVMHLVRTWVPPQFRGRGYGARLVKAGLEHARSEGYRVTTSCWFVDEFLERRPEYQDLVAD
ncbi:MAG: N-acetyltransferase [Gemmatimonadales bacterium]|nr:MAG: N-acetyltransferase [Gemmatimonadales bacterium]